MSEKENTSGAWSKMMENTAAIWERSMNLWTEQQKGVSEESSNSMQKLMLNYTSFFEKAWLAPFRTGKNIFFSFPFQS